LDVVEQFIGTWNLIRWIAKPANGDLFYPFGKDAVGTIVYDATDHVMVCIMKKERMLFTSSDFLQGSVEEVLAAYNGFVAYFGTYVIDKAEKKVIHRIQLSSFPNWVGQDQVRYYDLRNDFLTLRAPVIGTTQHELLWQKVQ
jgi:hypothetical protein